MRTSFAPWPRQGFFFFRASRTVRRSAGLMATAALLAACSPAAPPAEPVRAVKLMTVGVGALQARQEYSGEVRARVETRMGFRVAGKIVQRHAELGQRVQAGQVLAQLDPQDYQLAAAAARAQLSSAQTQFDLAAAEFKRFAALKEQNFISGAELERREASLKAAQSTLEQARAQASSQGNQAGYTRLVADVAGVATGIEAETGQVVAAGSPVVRIAQDGPRDVVFAVPEDRLAQVPVGAAARVRLWAAGVDAPALAAVVREVAASADPVTRTYQVKLSLTEGATAPLGATAYVTMAPPAGAPTAAIKLPTSALMRSEAGDRSGSAVWVFDAASSTVQPRPVVVAGADGNEMVIASGLKPGDEVVAAGVHVLSPGQKVTRFVGAATK